MYSDCRISDLWEPGIKQLSLRINVRNYQLCWAQSIEIDLPKAFGKAPRCFIWGHSWLHLHSFSQNMTRIREKWQYSLWVLYFLKPACLWKAEEDLHRKGKANDQFLKLLVSGVTYGSIDIRIPLLLLPVLSQQLLSTDMLIMLCFKNLKIAQKCHFSDG